MIYLQTGLRTANIRELSPNETPFNLLLKTLVQRYEGDKENVKMWQAEYFFSGEIKKDPSGVLIRNDEGVVYRDLIIIDVEDTGLTNSELIERITRLNEYNYYLYPSINHTEQEPRYRLVLEPDRNIVSKEEYKTNIKTIMQIADVKYDPSSAVWSQIQGLPIARKGEPYNTVKNINAKKWQVLTASVKEKKEVQQGFINDDEQVHFTDDEVIQMFSMYVDTDKNNLQDYTNALSVILILAKSVKTQVISYEAALQCADILAMDNPKWQEENPVKLNEAIKMKLEDIRTPYDFIGKMRTVKNKELNYLVNIFLKLPPQSMTELKHRLFLLGQSWRVENTTFNEKTGEPKTPIMNFNIISKFIRDNVPMVLIGDTEDTAVLHLYNFSKGIYVSSERTLNQLIVTLEDRFNPLRYKQVYNYLKTKVKYVRKLNNKNLIAVNNGVFNLQTKELYSFSPKYYITSKVDTNYNPYAYNPVDYFDVDSWLLSIANNDEEIYTLLWQMINEALNPNHTREKIGIMLGDGNNGKGTFQMMLTHLIGRDNIANLKPPQFANKFDLSQLSGKVCNIGDDISSKHLDDISNLMSIATGDPITIDRKNKDAITYEFKTLCIFSANEMPRIRNRSTGAYRRLLIIPFNADFNGAVQNRKIKDEYIKDTRVKEYILHTALNLDFEKFSSSKEVDKLLNDYKRENDYIIAYLEDEYIQTDVAQLNRVPLPYIKHKFEEYCRENKIEQHLKGNFGKTFAKHLTDYYKPIGYKFDCIKTKMTAEQKRAFLDVSTSPFYESDFVKNYAQWCIVKTN